MNLGAILDSIGEQVETFVFSIMQNNGIPASLMDKVLDGVQNHVRAIKAEEYAAELMRVQAEQDAPKTEEKTGTVEDLKKEMKENGSVCCSDE